MACERERESGRERERERERESGRARVGDREIQVTVARINSCLGHVSVFCHFCC